MKAPFPASLAIAVLLSGAVSAQAEEAPAAAPGCADQPKLQAEQAALKRTITTIALGGSDRRDRRRGAKAGKMAAQAVVGLFIPFGIGLAVGGGVALAEAADKQAKSKRPKPPPPPEPDVPAMIARQQQVEADLAALAAICPAMLTKE